MATADFRGFRKALRQAPGSGVRYPIVRFTICLPDI